MQKKMRLELCDEKLYNRFNRVAHSAVLRRGDQPSLELGFLLMLDNKKLICYYLFGQ